MVLGSHDTRVAEHAVNLFLQGYSPDIIFSGGLGRLTEGQFTKTEAETFADIAIKRGVAKEKILIENKSTNTGENIQFTKELLFNRGLHFNSFILVQKPYMERRTYATFKKAWSDKEFIVTSPQIQFDNYPTEQISREDVINIMVGDLQRIRLYPEKGFQIVQQIPLEVWNAYEYLVEKGYTKHLVKE